MATHHSTQKQKTITLVCNRPGGAVLRVTPLAASFAKELDALSASELNEMMRALRTIKTGRWVKGLA